MKQLLIAAGLYNLLWGSVAIGFPRAMLGWFGTEPYETVILLWQWIGMIVGSYGVGFLIASRDPYRHWPLVLVGFVGKLIGPVVFLLGLSAGTLPGKLGWTILTNDLIWLVPFVMILWGARRHDHAIDSAYLMPEADAPIRELRANTGQRLNDLANKRPQLIVLMRHAGCTFCRESMFELSQRREEIEATGCGIVLVHLGEGDGEEFFAHYGMDDVPRISDPECRLYRQFGLDLGGFSQLFGLRVWLRGIVAGLINGHGIGRAAGNTFQMPGVFTYHCQQVLEGYQYERASDRPDFVELATRATQTMPEATAV